MINPMLMVDGYKLGHHDQYPEGMNYLFSNFTARSDSHFKKIAVEKYMDGHIVVFGTTATVEYLLDIWYKFFFDCPRKSVVNEFANIIRVFLNDPTFSVEHVEALHDLGYLPVDFASLPEGNLCKIGVPFFTLNNTHEDFAWVVNYIETQLSAMLWKPITSATIARHYKVILNDFYNQTCDDKIGMDFMVHDFSMRGMSNVFDAYFSGMGHMTSFSGSDNIPAMCGVRDFYGYDIENEFLVGGVPATEHSVTSSNIRMFIELEGVDNLEAEKKTIEYLLDKHKTGFLSYVSDTYDYFGVLTDVLPALKDKIMSREGRFVVRPDSGNPIDIVCGLGKVKEVANFPSYENAIRYSEKGHKVLKLATGKYYTFKLCVAELVTFVEVSEAEVKGSLELLWETFGGAINEKGYRVLDSHIGLIYGDSITPARMHEILVRMKEMGFAASNVVFGAGSFTYQYTTRDTFGMAMKATYCEVNGQPIKLFKDPKTGDGSKKSAKGMLVVQFGELFDNLVFGEYDNTWSELQCISKLDGTSFSTIRSKVNSSLDKFKEI